MNVGSKDPDLELCDHNDRLDTSLCSVVPQVRVLESDKGGVALSETRVAGGSSTRPCDSSRGTIHLPRAQGSAKREHDKADSSVRAFELVQQEAPSPDHALACMHASNSGRRAMRKVGCGLPGEPVPSGLQNLSVGHPDRFDVRQISHRNHCRHVAANGAGMRRSGKESWQRTAFIGFDVRERDVSEVCHQVGRNVRGRSVAAATALRPARRRG